ncbi:glycoside hydrolase family 25 protein [Pedosphaera parvula]|uniref:Glycoside hydrolase family 25 n=1 Tax=Pedosphaera parvula (strain Ellin514) TaxID=320771 RepID=B9XRT6_PEDPL|nr:glycoside hydrolase family 25 protein [Pedosphaera parvula]EEF57447.1 glycoside hydrolase family 25 [Pedosphaera parvula Ellin514]
MKTKPSPRNESIPRSHASTLPRLAITAAALALALGSTHALAQRVMGIDVSSYQGTPNWSSVRSSGITFAWAKATEGTTITDGDFTYNENNGKAAGVYMGAYHFAHPNSASPSSEAGHFWAVAGGYIQRDGKSLMPTLDFEVFSGVVGASSYSDWANKWCNIIVSDAGAAGASVRPVIYTSSCSAGNFDGSVAQWIPWIANYNGQNPQTGTPWSVCGGYDVWGAGVWDAWQYSSSGSVPGIAGAVDLDVFNGSLSSLTSTLLIAGPPSGGQAFGDFSGDGRTDYVIFRPSTATWYIRTSDTGAVSAWPFGNVGDIPLIGNWTTATRGNFALFRPSTAMWYVRQLDGTINSFQWGQTGDIPLIGAWSGQMRDQVCFRPSNGTWYIRYGDTGLTTTVSAWGQTGDIPLVGNWGGAGMMDQTLFRPSSGTWYVRIGGGPNGGQTYSFPWGQSGDIPLIGAWSGQMRDSAMFRPSNGTWYIRFGDTGNTTSFVFGQNGDQPMVGNIFGNGMIDQIVFRSSNNTWYVRDGHTGQVYNFGFGSPGDQLVHE